MRFSERMGYKPVREQLQVDSMDEGLKTSLWNVFHTNIIEGKYEPFWFNYAPDLWTEFWRYRLDFIPKSSFGGSNDISIVDIKSHLSSWFFHEFTEWYEIYDFLEFTMPYIEYDVVEKFKIVLEAEMSAYRIVNDKFVQVTTETEIQSIEDSINNTEDGYKGVNIHLKSALTLLSDRQNPDYRNSIKESVSAVESLCKKLVDNDKARLSHAIKLLKQNHNAHPALLEAFEKLYGYTSDGDGIRHALMDDGKELDFHDAKYMLVTCSAFINLMIGKLEK